MLNIVRQTKVKNYKLTTVENSKSGEQGDKRCRPVRKFFRTRDGGNQDRPKFGVFGDWYTPLGMGPGWRIGVILGDRLEEKIERVRSKPGRTLRTGREGTSRG